MNRRQVLQGGLSLMALNLVGLPKIASAAVPSVALQIPDELMGNPLLDFSGLPKYTKISAADVVPAMDFLINQSKKNHR